MLNRPTTIIFKLLTIVERIKFSPKMLLLSIASLRTTFLILLAISFVSIAGEIKPACTYLTPNHVYLFDSTGCIDSDKTQDYDLKMTLNTGISYDGKFVMSEKDGVAQFFDTYYPFGEDWKIRTLHNNTLVLMYGSATDYQNDTIFIHLLGHLINDTHSNPIYLISGKVSGKNGDARFHDVVELLDLKFLNDSKSNLLTLPKMIGNQTPPLSNESQNKSISENKHLEPILLLAKSHESVYVEYSYGFTAKVYYANTNPRYDFDQYGGEVSDANVTVHILNWNGKVMKSFNGMTNRFGYFSDTFLIPDDFIPGKYVVTITAEKDGSVDSHDYILYVYKRGPEGSSTTIDCTARGPDVDLHGCNLSGADFEGGNLSGANLSYANLSNAIMKKTHDSVTNFFNAILIGVDLEGADLTNANLSNADLTNANLKKADLTNADLTNANLAGAITTGITPSTLHGCKNNPVCV